MTAQGGRSCFHEDAGPWTGLWGGARWGEGSERVTGGDNMAAAAAGLQLPGGIARAARARRKRRGT